MTRLTADAIATEQHVARMNERERDPDVVRNYLTLTQGAMADLSPADWVRLARLCRAINSWPGFGGPLGEPFRYFFGCLAADLYDEARTRNELTEDDNPALADAYHERIEAILSDSARRRAYGDAVAVRARGPRVGGGA